MLHPPRCGHDIGDYSFHDLATKWMMQHHGYPEIDRYRDANGALAQRPTDPERIVMLVDSIAEFWTDLPIHFVRPGSAVSRGIAGRSTLKMLLRFEHDIVALAPRTVFSLGGTDGLRCYVGDPASMADNIISRIVRNLTYIVDGVLGRRILPVICAILRVGRDRESVLRSRKAIVRANVMISALAYSCERGFVDFHSVLADSDGFFDGGFGDDGIHPNAAGYQTMIDPLRQVLAGIDTSNS